MSIIHQPRPEERAAQTSLRSLRKLDCDASVSKDGHELRPRQHPSFETHRTLRCDAPQDEVAALSQRACADGDSCADGDGAAGAGLCAGSAAGRGAGAESL